MEGRKGGGEGLVARALIYNMDAQSMEIVRSSQRGDIYVLANDAPQSNVM